MSVPVLFWCFEFCAKENIRLWQWGQSKVVLKLREAYTSHALYWTQLATFNKVARGHSQKILNAACCLVWTACLFQATFAFNIVDFNKLEPCLPTLRITDLGQTFFVAWEFWVCRGIPHHLQSTLATFAYCFGEIWCKLSQSFFWGLIVIFEYHFSSCKNKTVNFYFNLSIICFIMFLKLYFPSHFLCYIPTEFQFDFLCFVAYTSYSSTQEGYPQKLWLFFILKL